MDSGRLPFYEGFAGNSVSLKKGNECVAHFTGYSVSFSLLL